MRTANVAVGEGLNIFRRFLCANTLKDFVCVNGSRCHWRPLRSQSLAPRARAI
jgi:hypothetical protein